MQTAQSSDPAGIATATSKRTTGTSTGVGAFLVAQYAGNPTAAAAPIAGKTAFFDVKAAAGSAFSSLQVRQCDLPSGVSSLVWWNDSSWLRATPVTVADGCATLMITDTSSPTLSQLGGTVFAAGSLPVTRLSGVDRIRTAIAVSQEVHPSDRSAGAVVLARADTYPDALAGVPLAAAKRAPLLLTASQTLDPATLAEVKRVLPAGGTVHLLGGTASLSPAIAAALTAAGFEVDRIAGADRYGTAVAIAIALGNPTTVLVVPGSDFPDALSAGPAAAARGAAILLTAGRTQAHATATYLAAHPQAKRYAIGGLAATADPSAETVSGRDRYETSVRVAEVFFDKPRRIGLVSGENFPDGLSSAPAAGGPVLLVPGTAGRLPAATSGYLRDASASVTQLRVFGGTSVVTDALAATASRLLV